MRLRWVYFILLNVVVLLIGLNIGAIGGSGNLYLKLLIGGILGAIIGIAGPVIIDHICQRGHTSEDK